MQPKTISITVTVVSFIVSAILYGIFMSQAKEAKAFKKKNRFYMLGSSLAFFLIGLSGYFGVSEELFIYFNVHQVSILILGILNVILLRYILPWTKKVAFKWRFLFTINLTVFGILFLMLSYWLIGYEVSSYYILSSAIWFLVPFFFVESVERFFTLPVKVYKKWYYPVNEKIIDPSDAEMSNPVIVTYRFQRKSNSPHVSDFRVKAPLKMEFGRLFCLFINDYNEKYPHDTIEYLDKQNEPCAWTFYHKHKALKMKLYIDPELSIENNQIKEDHIIYCTRVNV